MLVRAPPLVGACRVCVCPPLGGECCVGVFGFRFVVLQPAGCPAGFVGALLPPPPYGLAGVGALLVCAPPLGGACCVGLWPPSWWGVLCWCVPPLLLGRAVLVPACRGGGVWFGLSSPVGWVVVAVVLLAWPGLVLCWRVPLPPAPCWGVPCLCVAPPLVRPAVSVCSGFGSCCCSWLDVRLVLLVRCCLRSRTAGVVGCWLSVLFAWPGLVLCWCVPPPLLGRAVLVRGFPLGGGCCVGVFEFWFVVS